MANLKEKVSLHCPNCFSKATYVVRHDSDWGSTNTMYRCNDDSCYPKESEEQDEFGDIQFYHCSDCYHDWF